ncbi:MAG TPA: VWA domain-containing protein [Candidatus Dormibacteraeota bacterium]|nr:VWA domain-containing protein [Candidatus Dormibacteraeota bacterium]
MTRPDDASDPSSGNYEREPQDPRMPNPRRGENGRRHTVEGASLLARSDRRYIRSTHRSERFVLVELEAPAAPRQPQRDPVNLAFVLDRSGSMSGQKIELAKRAIETAVDRLLPTDRFAVVCYDDRVDVIVEGTNASREAKTNAIERLRGIDARGSTDLGGGYLRGAEQVALGLVELGVNRVLLLTDGLANQGIVDPGELARHASELRARGVTTTTFGVGEDFDEALLQSMADAGGGHFYFIGDAAQIQDLIASEVGELLQVVARNVALEITAPEHLEPRSLSPYPVERRGSRFHVLLGDLVAEQRIEVVLRIKFGYGPTGQEIGILVGATDREGVLNLAGVAPVGVGWEYADDPTNDTQDRDRTVDRAVAKLFAARARQDAVKLNRLGDFREARLEIRGVAERIAGYAGRDPELRALIQGLRDEERQFSAPMQAMELKVAHAQASYALRSRAPDGRANR